MTSPLTSATYTTTLLARAQSAPSLLIASTFVHMFLINTDGYLRSFLEQPDAFVIPPLSLSLSRCTVHRQPLKRGDHDAGVVGRVKRQIYAVILFYFIFVIFAIRTLLIIVSFCVIIQLGLSREQMHREITLFHLSNRGKQKKKKKKKQDAGECARNVFIALRALQRIFFFAFYSWSLRRYCGGVEEKRVEQRDRKLDAATRRRLGFC